MRRDKAILGLLSAIADDVACDQLELRLPVRFLQAMLRDDRYYGRALGDGSDGGEVRPATLTLSILLRSTRPFGVIHRLYVCSRGT